MNKDKILVVDDDEIYARLVGRILLGLGYGCVICHSGEEAVACYERAWRSGAGFSAVLMDIECGCGMSGLESGRLLRSIDPGAKLILSSGHSDIMTDSEVRFRGFDANLPKPFMVIKLSETLRALLRR